MKIERYVQDEVMKYPVGEPIFVRDIIVAVSKCVGISVGKARFNVNVAMGRLVKGGKVLIKRFRNGIYYRYEKCVFGDTVIHKESLLFRKYLDGYIGYEIGPRVLHGLGLTTLLANSPRVFVSNAAIARSFKDKDLSVTVLKPKVVLNQNNFRYFQLLDVIKLTGEILIDNHEPLRVFERFFCYYKLDYGTLFFYAVKFFDKAVVDVVCSLFERCKGVDLYVST